MRTLFIAALSCMAGMTDAIGLIAAGNYVSFMSGNTTNIGVALAQSDLGHAGRLALVLVLFVLGSAAGEALAQWSRRAQAAVIGAVALMLTASGAIVYLADHGQRVADVWRPAAFLIAVLAMGVLNAAFEKSEGQSVGLTYVTGALARLGQSLGRYVATRQAQRPAPHLAAFCGLLVGAIIGALLQNRWPSHAIFVPAAMAWLLCALALRIGRASTTRAR
ncbi:hypothetical protein CAL12_26765 [Bordetella genomosp. 8]|uniref:DUF1275 family protein n=1 Tax=Bordetella genomosp. 8 TaxID=1416806 RepID=A0A1W6YSS8_9BORD|nr:YoaK family protein [Bordetella genomosp. 8]ARP84061.1 hypothetical protein CAL12_26765 [Bordetella genomosp. 8]